MIRLKTKTELRRHGQAQRWRGEERREQRSGLRSLAASYRHFWLHCARAWRLINFNDRREARS